MPYFQSPIVNYLSELPVSRPPVILNRAPVEKGAHFQSLCKALVEEPPAKFPSGAPTESNVRPLSRPPCILLDPQKEAPPNRAPTKRDAPFPDPSNYLLKFPGSQRGPYRERHPSPKLSSTPFPQSPR